LTNGGTISANTVDDASLDVRFNNAVFSEGGNTRVVNLAGGILSAISSEGNGVRFGENNFNDMDGSSLLNYGTIVSANSDGVHFQGQVDDTLTLENYGTISGASNAFFNAIATTHVINRGAMNGNVQFGAAGNDTFDGRRGTVDGTVSGCAGDDTYIVSDADLELAENAAAGTDTVKSTVSFSLGDNFENLTLLTNNDINGTGNSDANVLIGNSGDNRLAGKSAADTISGGDGDDRLFGGVGLDTLNGDDGDDILRGGLSNDELYGGDDDDILIGNRQNDKMYGGGGDDTIIGGLDKDNMYGGTGEDTFVFNRRADSKDGPDIDLIRDFVAGEDVIDLTGLNPALTFIGAAAFSGSTGEVRLFATGTGNNILQIDLDGDGTSDMKIAMIGTIDMTVADILV
jgi:serralysin